MTGQQVDGEVTSAPTDHSVDPSGPWPAADRVLDAVVAVVQSRAFVAVVAVVLLAWLVLLVETRTGGWPVRPFVR